MFWRKIIFLAAGYIAWNVVASIYSGSRKKAKKAQSGQDVKMMVENFLDTQKNFIADMEDRYLSDESKAKLADKKQEFKKFSEKYIKEGEKLLAEVKKNENVVKWRKKVKDLASDLQSKGRAAIAKAGEKLKKENENEF